MPTENPYSWRFVVPLYMGSTLNPINSSMIATTSADRCIYTDFSGSNHNTSDGSISSDQLAAWLWIRGDGEQRFSLTSLFTHHVCHDHVLDS